MQKMSTTTDTLVSKTKTHLRKLANRRTNGKVTADDANAYLMTQGVRSSKIGTRLAVINSVFGSNEFRPVGQTASARPAAKGRTITEWALR